MKHRQLATLIAIAVSLIIVGHLYLDTEIARYFGELLKQNNFLSRYASEIPDLLLPVSVIFTFTSWVLYSWLVYRGNKGACIGFFHLTGWTVPLSFLIKTGFKDIFGKINTRYWLEHGNQYGFHWLNSSDKFNGFPSGHMVVFTVIILAMWRFFPRTRYAGAIFLILLAAALIITDYHFFSDVVAGALLGFVVDASISNIQGVKRAAGR